MPKKFQRRRAGVTLMELMLASGIIAVTMTAMFGAAMTVTTLGKANVERMSATTASASLLEEISRLDVSQLEDYTLPQVDLPGAWNAVIVTAMWETPDGGRSGMYLALNVDGEEYDQQEMDYEQLIPDDAEVEVNVQIYWREDNGRFYHIFSSVMAKG